MKSVPIRKTGVLLTAVSLAWLGDGVSAFGADTGKQFQPPGFSTSLKGAAHDFDYLVGAWTTQQKRLKAVAVGSSEWAEAPANRHCAVPYYERPGDRGAKPVSRTRVPRGCLSTPSARPNSSGQSAG